MEAVNLAQSSLGTSVTCDTISSSATPLEGLLGPGPRHWMADSFIRAPASICLHLPLPVRLARLSWDTVLGSQSSSLHEVWVSTEISALAGGHGGQAEASQLRAGRGEARDGRIEFSNPRLVSWTDTGGAHMLCTREHKPALARVTAITIRILRTEANTVPCLGNIKLFGVSTGLRHYKTRENEIIQRSLNPESGCSSSQPTFSFFGGSIGDLKVTDPGPSASTSSSDVRTEPDDGDVPEEFLDSITQTLMLLPMTLPSGHNVDRSTVDRCGEMFSSWGGQPRDPFTGRLFSGSHLPVFNAPLKARIDQFRLSAPAREQDARRGRTLGDAKMIQDFLTQKQELIHRKLPHMKRKLSEKDGLSRDCDQSDKEADHDNSNDLDEALSKSLSRVKRILK